MSERVLDNPPNLLGLYGKAALGGLPGADKLPLIRIGGRSSETPDTQLVVPSATADADRVAEYCRVCGFTLRDVLPPTYPHMLAFPMQMSLMCEEDFPFGGIGLVHIANEITQHRPIKLSEALEIRVRVSDLRPHPKGRQFDFISEARSGTDLVWESVSTTLSRGAGADPNAADKSEEFESVDFDAMPATAEWKLPAGLGRSYGGVSGDRNPIHMSEWTAKPLGFPKAIAHGMWTKARALAALEGDLPEALKVSVRFKRPILLPGRVSFATVPRLNGAAFAVRDARKGTPHLEGILESL
ncbi:MAG TPA: MaoC/PaaZ C-terminal domain-containing protein [Solirubrobacterales bacterium]|nr:MaoC/PaaZ C-terminal domain-containing protein [Solirubrobacterales bacterium]